MICDLSRGLLSSYKSGFNRLARRTWHALHATPTLFAWFGSSDFYLYPTVKENSNGFRWLTRTSFWVPARDFEEHRSRRIEWRISSLDAAGSRSKSKQWRLRQMINNFHRYWLCFISSDGLEHVLIQQTMSYRIVSCRASLPSPRMCSSGRQAAIAHSHSPSSY
jgi:hypothetical protein